MSLRIDVHLHTRRYSGCSKLDPNRLIKQAVKVGLDGVVIMEHHHVWGQEELDELLDASGEQGFLLLSGFEYTSTQGDVLIYGLGPEEAEAFKPGGPPEEAIERAMGLGAVCVAAHPTRAGLGFDERILSLPLAAIEVQSVNLKEHEQRLAINLAKNIEIPAITGSDAHNLDDVGCFTTDFFDPIRSMPELKEALERGRFRPSGAVAQGVGAH